MTGREGKQGGVSSGGQTRSARVKQVKKGCKRLRIGEISNPGPLKQGTGRDCEAGKMGAGKEGREDKDTGQDKSGPAILWGGGGASNSDNLLSQGQ